MSTEYINKLKSFSDKIGGDFSESREPTTRLRGGGWSRVEIRLPIPQRNARFIAFSGTNTAEVYSGFYAESKLQEKLVCTITQRNKVLSLINNFNKLKIKSGRASFDKALSVLSNDKMFVHKLSSDKEIASFLETNLKLPMRFEVVSNISQYIKDVAPQRKLISISTNEWLVDEKQLMDLYAGFRMIILQVP